MEEEKRLADLRAEQERIKLQQEEDRRRRAEEEAERKRRQEEETERLRAEAERKRQEDLERQRAENERQRREAEEAEIQRRRQQELDAEQNRLLAMQADDMTRWVFALQQAITRNFIPPASSPIDLECVVDVRQLPGGVVANVSISRCNGDEAVQRAIIAAVNKASPLPAPDNPRIFERDLRITFKPEQ
jgi:colicin import membrane protein